MASEIKISSLPQILSGSYNETGIIPTVINGVTYHIDVKNLRPILLEYYKLTGSFDSNSDIEIPVSSAIYSKIIAEISSSIDDNNIISDKIKNEISSSIDEDNIVYNTIETLINEQTSSLYISSSQIVDNDLYKNILVTTDSNNIILQLSGNNDGKITNISKIDSGSGYVRISSSINDVTILDDEYFNLYYQYECVNLQYNANNNNYILI